MMKKFVSLLLSICLLLLICACSNDEPKMIGSWKTETSILGGVHDADEIRIIFYDGIEGQEDHIKNGTTYKTYQFDYEIDVNTLTIYTGATQTTYTISYGKQNDIDTMTLTSEDGTVYSYVLTTRITPGIRG